MDVGTLEQWLWDAACEIRGPLDAPKFKDYILPLVFLKRLSDVFEDEISHLASEFGNVDKAATLMDKDRNLVRFYVPEEARWPTIASKTTGLGEYLTSAVRAVAKANPRLQGVIDVKDFNETAAGQRVVDDPRLQRLVQELGKHRLGIDDVEPDIFGRAYEYLLRKFAEGGGASAGEFYTPREVGVLMARILDPQPGMTVYDPCCGSAGLLIKCHLRLLETHGKPDNGRLRLPPEVAPLRLFGQEINASTYAMSRMNAVIHDMEAEITLGDTMRTPRFADKGKLRRFDLVTANPMWNQDFPVSTYEHDAYDRFIFGIPPSWTADWGWVQHMLHSLNDAGRMAVVLDTNAVSRGSGAPGKNRERDIRRAIIEADLVEAVVLLPENLFYNTGAPGIVAFLNKKKPASRQNRILLINLSQHLEKGSPKNLLPDSAIETAAAVFAGGLEEPGISKWIRTAEAKAIDYDISPARHVPPLPRERTTTLDAALESFAVLNDERKRVARARKQAFAAVRAVEASDLEQDTPIGEIPSDWRLVPVAEAFSDSKSGDWGRDVTDAHDDFVLCKVIKGTNFPDVEALNLAGVPERLIKRTTYKNRRPQAGDLLIEISGGGKYQATGRVLFVSDELLGLESTPLFFTNFLKLLRPDQAKFEPRFLYHYWRMLYVQRRTEIYEKQPTNIKNFKYKDFLASERIPMLDRQLQVSLSEVLDIAEQELRASNRAHAALEDLFRIAGYDLLVGRFSIEASNA